MTQRGTIPESRWTDQFTSAMCCSPPRKEASSPNIACRTHFRLSRRRSSTRNLSSIVGRKLHLALSLDHGNCHFGDVAHSMSTNPDSHVPKRWMYWIPLLSACSTGLAVYHEFEFACGGLNFEFSVGTTVLHVFFAEPGSILEDGFSC